MDLFNFGTYNSFFNFIAIITFPIALLQTFIIKNITDEDSYPKIVLNLFVFLIINLSILIFLYIFFYDFLYVDLKFYNIEYFYFNTFIIILFSYLNVICLSFILKNDQYLRYNFFSQIFFIFKIILIFLITYLSVINFNNAIYAYSTSLVLAFFIILIFNLSFLKKIFNKHFFNNLNFQAFKKEYFLSIKSIFIIQIIFMFYINADILICRRFCTIEESNSFASISVYSKILFHLMSSVIAIFFNIISNNKSENNLSKLLQIYLYFVPIIILSNIIIIIFPKIIILFLLDDSYFLMIRQLIILNISMCFLILSNYNLQFILSLKNPRFYPEILIIIISLIITIIFNQGSSYIISIYFLLFSLSIFICSCLRIFILEKTYILKKFKISI